MSRLLFRCDASPSIGAGHAVRCRSLALALRERGVDSVFLMRPGWEVEGFEVVEAAGGSETELDTSDRARTVELAHERGCDGVVVDHYGASAEYLAGLREAGPAVGVLDDVADRDLRAADWILNQNLAGPRLEYRARPDALLLLGPSYALLRPEFVAARASFDRAFASDDARVLVTFGGGETAALCEELLGALESVPRRLEVGVVAADAGRALEEAARASRHAVRSIGGVRDMAGHMLWADVSVNAGGSTCWELLCLGVPMVVLALSGDQRGNPAALGDAGAAVAVGTFDEAGRAVEELLADPERRRAMSAVGLRLVDGRGAERAAAAVVEAGERVSVGD